MHPLLRWCVSIGLITAASFHLAHADTPQQLQAQATALRQMSIHDQFGQSLDLAHPPGRLLFIDFWAYWCPNCIREMHDLEELQRQLGPDRISIVLVSSKADWVRDRAYASAHALPFPLYVFDPAPVSVQATALKGQQVGNAVRVMLPTATIFLPTGQLLTSAVGAHHWASPELISDFKAFAKRP